MRRRDPLLGQRALATGPHGAHQIFTMYESGGDNRQHMQARQQDDAFAHQIVQSTPQLGAAVLVTHPACDNRKGNRRQQAQYRPTTRRVVSQVVGLRLTTAPDRGQVGTQVGPSRRWAPHKASEARVAAAHKAPDHAPGHQGTGAIAQRQMLHTAALALRSKPSTQNANHQQPVEDPGGQIPNQLRCDRCIHLLIAPLIWEPARCLHRSRCARHRCGKHRSWTRS